MPSTALFVGGRVSICSLVCVCVKVCLFFLEAAKKHKKERVSAPKKCKECHAKWRKGCESSLKSFENKPIQDLESSCWYGDSGRESIRVAGVGMDAAMEHGKELQLRAHVVLPA